jgi:hypothetical protein
VETEPEQSTLKRIASMGVMGAWPKFRENSEDESPDSQVKRAGAVPGRFASGCQHAWPVS